jgi:hypothetical protein
MSRGAAPAVAPRRGVLGGAVLLAIGGAFLLPPLGVPNAGAYLFVALGIAFAAAWWVGARQYVYLVPACVLIGFGLGLVIPTALNLPPDTAGPVFLGTLAGGVVAVFILAPIRRAHSSSPGSWRPSRSRISSCGSIWSRWRCSRTSCRWS